MDVQPDPPVWFTAIFSVSLIGILLYAVVRLVHAILLACTPVADSGSSFDALFEKKGFAAEQANLSALEDGEYISLKTTVGMAMVVCFANTSSRSQYGTPRMTCLRGYFGRPACGGTPTVQHERFMADEQRDSLTISANTEFEFMLAPQRAHDQKHSHCTWEHCRTDRTLLKRRRCNQCILRRCVQNAFPTVASVDALRERLPPVAAEMTKHEHATRCALNMREATIRISLRGTHATNN
jgi:hypothetical protein